MNIKYLCAALALVGLAGCQYTSPDVAVQVDSEYVAPNDLLYADLSGRASNQVPTNLLGLDGVNVDAFTKDADGKLIFSIDAMHLVSGVLIRPGDVFRCEDANCDSLIKLVDVTASTQLPDHVNVDAVSVDEATGKLFISIDQHVTYQELVSISPITFSRADVTPSDVMEWRQVNPTTQNFGSKVFDGANFAKQGINLDALDAQSDQLNMSFDVTVTLPVDGGGNITVKDDEVTYWKISTSAFTGKGGTGLPEHADADAFYAAVPPAEGAIFSDGFE